MSEVVAVLALPETERQRLLRALRTSQPITVDTPQYRGWVCVVGMLQRADGLWRVEMLPMSAPIGIPVPGRPH